MFRQSKKQENNLAMTRPKAGNGESSSVAAPLERYFLYTGGRLQNGLVI